MLSLGVLVSEMKANEKMENSGMGQKHGNGNGIFSVYWKRVVLDEAHIIKNSSTEAAKACYLVSRVVTGTSTDECHFQSCCSVAFSYIV